MIKSEVTGTVVWLGRQPVPVEKLVITSEPVEAMPLSFAGPEVEVHAGETRPSCSRVLGLYPRGTTIRNVRQLCVVSVEEMAAVAGELGIAEFDYAWVGASVVIAGIPDFTHLPPSSRLQGPDGVTIVVDMENLPCQEPAVTIEQVLPGQGKGFKAAAKGRRGVTAWVERPGVLRLGDVVTLHVPAQRAWEPGRVAAAGEVAVTG
jgi:hypothetical protein